MSARLIWRLFKREFAFLSPWGGSVCSQGVGGKGAPRCPELRKAAPQLLQQRVPTGDPKVSDLTGDPALLHLRVPRWPGEERSKD